MDTAQPTAIIRVSLANWRALQDLRKHPSVSINDVITQLLAKKK